MLLWWWLILLLLLLLLGLGLLGWLFLRACEINCFLIRRCWPDRTCGGDRGVPGIDFWDRLGCPSRWWRW